ncbi:PREDICTED: transcriptional adapter 2-alpha-like isoform X1 [Amphimedon queenslandica]|uniref:SWIRM domain-containing protein n=1 Tax=Amphimedon queenslandica TaxID=400682 RepID=A0AAN0JX08_AMPQE|nr:PREDICTED: transcriptional adapter 2-alpha-like isoform X1 [Amphimedon queenslandica]|eukprot:XP_019861636.1 PREDICTED: transcriptional adapter 2-alpha-like isoform X1 [Amphimedon queenslandica]
MHLFTSRVATLVYIHIRSVRVLMRRFARFLDAETTEKLIQSFLNEKRLIKRIKCLQTYRCLGIKTLAGSELYERLREKREKTRERMKASLDLITKNNKSIASTEQQNATISCTNIELQGQQAMCSTGKTKYSLTPLNITYSPGVEQLDHEEKQICSVHRILPDVYLHCKGVMIAESRKCGGKLRLMDARKLCRIDVNKTRKIYNHFLSKELVQPPS